MKMLPLVEAFGSGDRRGPTRNSVIQEIVTVWYLTCLNQQTCMVDSYTSYTFYLL